MVGLKTTTSFDIAPILMTPYLLILFLVLQFAPPFPSSGTPSVNPSHPSSSSSSSLQFHSDGTFKILQVADLHYEKSDADCRDIDPIQYPHCVESNSTTFIQAVIELEKPDLVVYTGDNIDFATPIAKVGLREAFAPAEKTNTPWAGVLGNHDGQAKDKTSRHDVTAYMCDTSVFPHSLTQMGPSNIHGYTNYKLDILPTPAGSASASVSNQADFELVFLDSGNESQDPEIPYWEWFHLDQLWWFENLASVNPKTPRFVFFHIPLIEFWTLVEEGFPYVGNKLDVGAHMTKINSGGYATFLKGNVKGVFVGHEHLNDYCGKFWGGGIQLCFGGVVGLDAYSKAAWPRRVRLIEIQDGGKSAETWKRLFDGKMTIVDREKLF